MRRAGGGHKAQMEEKIMYRTVLLDLDGTLTDPALGITGAIMYALEQFHIRVEERSSLYPFIGPPLSESFERYYHFNEEETGRAVAYYREYYGERGLYENTLYDGVPQLLAQIRDSGRRIVLATSKPEEFTVRILEHFQIDKYFDFVATATLDGSRSTKADVVAYALREGGITDRASTVMVGDRKYDILGANAAGLDSIGVLYGYGSREELQKAGATHIAESVADVMKFL